jgi:hypothetical protein
MVSDAVRREAARGKKMLEEISRHIEAERKRERMFFPSLDPSSRKWVSPLGGLSPGVWR